LTSVPVPVVFGYFPYLEFFNDNDIRKVWHSGEEELSSKWGTICTPLQMIAPDGKMRKAELQKGYSNKNPLFSKYLILVKPKSFPVTFCNTVQVLFRLVGLDEFSVRILLLKEVLGCPAVEQTFL
jgi:hypothetical protein